MKWVERATKLILVLAMLGSCFWLEYYTYQSQETILQIQKEVGNKKKPEEITTGTTLENEEKKKEQSKKVAYLTFDDGPSKVTERILDVLEVYDIPATFFLIGCNITEERVPVIERMIENKNAIGIHTYCHKAKEIYSSTQSYLEDLEKTKERIYEVTGKEVFMIRFPWGSANNYLKKIEDSLLPTLEEKGYYYCDWNVSAEDSIGKPTRYSILQNVKKDFNRYDNPIVLMHDSATSSLTAEMLPDIIVMLKEAGYQFDTLDHMDKPYQYPRD
ncbi:MAG: polysaccharide deacetylase [Clostridiales bacterium]|nr:polysaccharide deacetylase [Clostridiales bacterium]